MLIEEGGDGYGDEPDAAGDASDATYTGAPAQSRLAQTRTSARVFFNGLAATAMHAPALLRAGPSALAAAANRLSQPSGKEGAGGWESDEEDSEGDFVLLEDGTKMSLEEHVTRVRR